MIRLPFAVLLFVSLCGCEVVGPDHFAEMEDGAFVRAEQMPRMMGGLEGLLVRLKYPKIAKKAGVAGDVRVRLVVTPAGAVTDPLVREGIGAGCDEEAVRIIMQSRFVPGYIGQQAVPVRLDLEAPFRLPE